ncbi:MAG: acetate/propionate family kinase [Burkholderiales bacterium]|nr:acetate/propionate family kinase [Burkholderiales bacterium]
MADAIAVLNAGSSSLKFSLYLDTGDDLEWRVKGKIDNLPGAGRLLATGADGRVVAERRWTETVPLSRDDAVGHVMDLLNRATGPHPLRAIGHRVVHGGPSFTAPVRVDTAVLAQLERLTPLALLHQPHNLAPIRPLLASAPQMLQVACFDTAFHRTQPDLAQRFGLPEHFWDAGVRRYGFHGLSYEFIASRLPQIDARAATGRTIVLHLGNGASLCALRDGRSVATSMGFTALDGLMMGTRSGSLDPGLLLYLQRERGMSVDALEHLLYHDAGLKGVSGISGDMQVLRASEDPQAKLAIDLFCYRIARELGSAAAALGGLDAIVFTAGIGEHHPAIRAQVCRDAAWLGVTLDTTANDSNATRISTADSSTHAFMIRTDEEIMIAQHVRTLLRQG